MLLARLLFVGHILRSFVRIRTLLTYGKNFILEKSMSVELIIDTYFLRGREAPILELWHVKNFHVIVM